MSGPTDPAEEHFDKGGWGFDGTVWRKLPLLFGYLDRWEQSFNVVLAAAVDFQVYSTAVPPGYVYILQAGSLANTSGARGTGSIALYGATGPYYLAGSLGLGQYEVLLATGAFVLKEGDRVRLRMNGCLEGDYVLAGVWGYKMAVV